MLTASNSVHLLLEFLGVKGTCNAADTDPEIFEIVHMRFNYQKKKIDCKCLI